ncbi:M20/M25/M40 family metallo-hydrolase [Phenylobacterium sp.]|uniref:M20/M25/M40 family metallo-hydrolase n=1 Tax=Phenylobacterium sp. TaxID=1871053 RepID=UPI0035B4DA84
MGRSIALALCLAIGFFLAWIGERTPPPAPANAPAADFSAMRAMADVEAIASKPHPMGGQANAAARDHLLARMTALGLAPRLQQAEVLRHQTDGKRTWAAGGRVENIVGVLPGRDRAAPALALMAHYDSVPGSPGAADDAAGTAAALEIVRALKAQGTPARDVIVLLTDGEESGLLGAQAFFDQHPLARRIGFLINMESRGGAGRAQMFQTGGDNAGAIGLLQRGSVSPAATSLTVFLYEQMPNDTDFSVSKAAGVPGLNYAFIGAQYDYHAPTSTPANLDKGSLQHIGQEVLAATRQAAFAPTLPANGPNLVYANVYGGKIIAYAPAAGWLLLAAIAVLIAVGAWRARRTGVLALVDVAKGAGAALYLVTLAVVALRLARRATGAGFGFLEQHYLLAQAGRWEIALALLSVGALAFAAAASGRGRTRLAAAVLVLALGAACSAFGHLDTIALAVGGVGAALALVGFGRPAGAAGAWAGVLAVGFLAASGLQAAAPTTAMLVAWPLALAALAAALTAFASRRSLPVLVLLTAAGGAGLGWVLAFGHGVYLGLDLPELLAAIAWIAALLIWPLAHAGEDETGARTAALAIMVLGAVTVAIVRFDPPWTARHPQPTHIAYYLDPQAGRTLRISDAPALPAWTRQALSVDGGTVEKIKLPALRRGEVWAAPASGVAAPPVEASFGQTAEGARQLVLTPPPGTRALMLHLKSDAALTDVTVNGKPAAMLGGPGASARISWEGFGDGSTGLVVRFRAAGPGALQADYAAVLPQPPAGARPLPQPPPELAGFGESGAALIGGARKFVW